MLLYLIQGFSLGISAAAQPGPFVAYLSGQALRLGWRRALPAIMAPLISDGPIITIILLVLTRFPPGFLRAIQVAGGLFVLYLAWKSYRAWRTFRPEILESQSEQISAERQSVLQAAAMNFLSPGPYLFWSLVGGPLLLKGWSELPSLGVAFLSGFYLAMLGVLAGLVILFSTARHLGPQVSRFLLGLSALALAGFGLWQVAGGVKTFVY